MCSQQASCKVTLTFITQKYFLFAARIAKLCGPAWKIDEAGIGFQGLGFYSGFASDFLDDPGQKVSVFLPWIFCILFSKRFMCYLPPL